jgi:ribosome maturation factor RimP
MTARDEPNRREDLEARILGLAEQVAASMGLEIVLVEIKGGSSHPVVRTYIDKPGGVTLDDCEHLSKRLSVVLDVEDWIPFSYNLEVSSPGLDRPLVKEADFERFAGRSARVRTRLPLEGQKNFKGKILRVARGKVEIEVAPGRQVDIAVGDIEKANLILEI